MSKPRVNPFKFGDPVEGDYFLPRPELTYTVRQFLENRIHVVLIGPRRFGKTSFTVNLLKKMEKEGYTCIFIDIFNITSHRDFLHQLIRVFKSQQSWGTKFKAWLKTLHKIRPKVLTEIDPYTGVPSFELSLEKSSDKNIKDHIQDLLSCVDQLGEKVIFVMDEFQKITEIDDKGWLEATLRTHMQQLKNTSFLFTGSRRSLIYDMLNNSSRPLYRSCQSIEFPSFGPEFTDWVIKRFRDIGSQADAKAVNHLRKLVQDTPNYVQMICFHLVARGVRKITVKEVTTTLEMVVRQNAYAYQTLLNTLTPIQQRSLRLAAKAQKQIYAKDLLYQYEISTGPALASAIKSLKDKGILEEEGTSRGKVTFDDPLFAIWLRVAF